MMLRDQESELFAVSVFLNLPLIHFVSEFKNIPHHYRLKMLFWCNTSK